VRNAKFFTEMVWGNARLNRYDGCVMHGSTDMMGAGYKVLSEWLGGMHGSTGMMGAYSTVQPVRKVGNARFHRNGLGKRTVQQV